MLDHHYVIAVRAAAAFAAVTLVGTLIAASAPAAPHHEGMTHGSDSEYEGWRDATRVTYAYNTTKAAFFAWRQPIYETASNTYLPASCKCTLSSELTNGAQLPMLPETHEQGLKSFPITPGNPLYKPPVSVPPTAAEFKDIKTLIQKYGFNGAIAYIPNPASAWHGIGGSVLTACIKGTLGADCKVSDVIEIAMEHEYRAGHDIGKADGVDVWHGAIWSNLRVLALEMPDEQAWSDVILGQFCPHPRVAAGQWRGCGHAVGHGSLLRAYGQKAYTESEDAPADKAMLALKNTMRMCMAAPSPQMAYECACGGYMMWTVFLRRLAETSIDWDNNEGRGWAYPCALSDVDLPMAAPCFIVLFLYAPVGKGTRGKPWLASEGLPATHPELLRRLDCYNTTTIPSEKARLGCIFAFANVFFPKTDNFWLKSTPSESDKTSTLTFLQGSGYVEGHIVLPQGAELCGDLPDECFSTSTGAPIEPSLVAASKAKPSTILDFCKTYVPGALVGADGLVLPHMRRRWLACVAGAVSGGWNERFGEANVGDVVDTFDVPAYIVRRVCNQLRGYQDDALGHEAASLCEFSALYLGATTDTTLDGYSAWPLHVLEA